MKMAAPVAFFLCLAVAAPAAEWRLWNLDIVDRPDRAPERGPAQVLRIAGARNGTFSGAVLVESDAAIEGLRAELVPAPARGLPPGPGDLVQVRYGVDGPAVPRRPTPPLDALLEAPPATVPPGRSGAAQVSVWVTIRVPPQTAAGVYAGTLKVTARDRPPLSVPVELIVSDWALPDPQQWRTWLELLQSPDTLALEYDVPLWSERHWALVAESFRRMSGSGSRVVYLPLIRQTNQGHAQSLLRWRRDGRGGFTPDFTVLERYLDLAVQHLGTPKAVILYAWDTHLLDPEQVGRQASRTEARLAVSEQGVPVTLLDAAGAPEEGFLPPYWDPASEAIWKPAYAELRARLRKRGLEGALLLGMVTDVQPSERQVRFLHDVSGGLAWAAHRHAPRTLQRPPPNGLLHGIADVAYEAHVYHLMFRVNPDLGRAYGWRAPELRVSFDRNGIPNTGSLRIRLMPEFSITGEQRGVGRVGADFWYVLRDRQGQRTGPVYARYPASNWRNLDIESWVLAPGPDGPVATARFENLREGMQECEARIFLEDALLDAGKRRRLGDELAGRIQALLDERQRALWRTEWSDENELRTLGAIEARNFQEAVWGALRRAGKALPDFWSGEARQLRQEMTANGVDWFVASGWKDRTARLYDLAGEARKKLGDR